MVKVSIIGKGKFGSKIEDTIKDTVEFVEPNDADWIILATPNDLHHEQVEYWLSQRKNVFCEKPLTLTKRSAEALFSLADFFSVKLYVDDVFHWHDNITIDTDSEVDFMWYKYGSFGANIIDNLAYHHFYTWVGSDDIEIESITDVDYKIDGTIINFRVELKDGRTATFDYSTYDYNGPHFHKIVDGWDEIDVEPNNNPLKDMLHCVMLDEVKWPDGGGPTVNFEDNKKRTLNAIKLCEAVKKEVYPKVLVVGGGIFGTTASVALATSGFNVTLHEELDHVIMAASDINQYRLHRGYHYPRSKSTAQECLDGLKSFKRKYGASVVNDDINHFYAISSRDSLVSSEDYTKFLALGVAIPPYSGTIKIKPSDWFKLFDISIQVSTQTPSPFFLSGVQRGNEDAPKSREKQSRLWYNSFNLA